MNSNYVNQLQDARVVHFTARETSRISAISEDRTTPAETPRTIVVMLRQDNNGRQWAMHLRSKITRTL